MTKYWMLGLALALGYLSSAAFGQYGGAAYPNNHGLSAFPLRTATSSHSYAPVHAYSAPVYSNTSQQPVPTNSHVRSHAILNAVPTVPQGYDAHQPTTYGIVGPNQAGQYQMVGTQQQIYSGGIADPHPAAVAPSLAAPQHVAPMSAPAHAGTTQMAAPTPTPMNHSIPSTASMPSAGCTTCNQSAPMSDYVISAAPGCATCGPTPISGGYMAGGCGDCYTSAPTSFQKVGLPLGGKPWFFGVNALIFNRVDSKNIPLAYADGNFGPDILTTRDARQRAAGGFETTIGRYFNCGKNAFAFTYWGVFPEDQAVSRTGSAGAYRSRLPFTYLEMPGTPSAPTTATPVYDWYDAAFTHSVQRSFEYHNVEFNLLGFAAGHAARNFNLSTQGTLFSGTRRARSSSCGYCGGAGCGSCGSSCGSCGSCGTDCGGSCSAGPVKYATSPCMVTPPACPSKFNLTWLAGFRYFRFSDNLFYAASLDNAAITRAGDDIYYDVNTTNDLVGFQIGSRMDYCIRCRVNLYGLAKVGIYNNRSSMYSRVGSDFQYAYLNDTRGGNTFQGQDFLFDETKDSVAFLSELGTGVGVRVSPKWTATFGYRAVIASGVATAPDNVLSAYDNYANVRDYNNYGTLILHGFNIGAQYNF